MIYYDNVNKRELSIEELFYDIDKGFTTIDVSLLSESKVQYSLKDVNYFFEMFSSVFLVSGCFAMRSGRNTIANSAMPRPMATYMPGGL